MAVFLQILANGILTASIYALIAAGISFLYYTSKIFHLAHGVVVLGAGYTFWWVWRVLGWHPLIAILLAVLVAALSGVLMNEFVYEVLRKRKTKGLGYLISTLALLLLGTSVILALFGAAPKTFSFQTNSHIFEGVYFTTLQFWIVISSLLLLASFWYLVKYTAFGKALRATADNEAVAEVVGINTKKIRRIAFALSSLLAASAGILRGLEFNLDPNMGILSAVYGFAAAVIGGVGNFAGALLGGLVLGLGDQITGWFFGAGWRNALTFLILFLFLLWKPGGILGERKD